MRPMRRKDRIMSEDLTQSLLLEGDYGILSTNGVEGPYGVPISYVYMNNAIYVHCAMLGHKIDNITHDAKVCFTIVRNAAPSKTDFSINYESVVVFGVCETVSDDAEKKAFLMKLSEKYVPHLMDNAEAYISNSWNATKVLKIPVNEASGKSRNLG